MKKVWFSFKSLNEFFEIDSKQKGCYIDMDKHHHTGFDPAWNRGIPHSQDTKDKISAKHKGKKLTEEHKEAIRKGQPKTKKGGKWCDEARKRRSEMQTGKKRGPYKKQTK